jgi:hypothetical protein
MDSAKFGSERLNATNYATWNKKMEAYLNLKGLAEPLTSESAADGPKCLGALTLAVEDSILPLIADATTAKAAWEKLKEIYKTKSTASIIRLKAALNSLCQGNTELITTYVGRAAELRSSLAAGGYELSDLDFSLSILSGLLPDYAMIKTVVENSEPFPCSDAIVAKLLAEESKLIAQPFDEDESAFGTSRKPFYNVSSLDPTVPF